MDRALDAAVDLLGLRPAAVGTARPDGAVLGVLTARGRARFLLPLDHRPATLAACLAYQGLRSPKAQASRLAAAAAVRLGAHRFTRYVADTGPGSLLAHLGALLGEPEPSVAVGLGIVDAVWKPTLQVFAPDGTPLAFVKVGRGPVAHRLVSREAEVLTAWQRHPDPRLVVPALVADTTWNGTRLVVVAPLPADARRLPSGAVSAWAVRTLDETLPPAVPADAPWWQDRRAAESAEPLADHDRVTAILDAVERRHGSGERDWARWHGDWVRWNLARCHLGLAAWDWEYSEPGAPVGLDEVHAAYQQVRVVGGRPVLEALAAARAVAPTSWVADAHVAMLVTRSGELTRLAGRPPPERDELLAAAAAALR